jgi:hypothetical protein
MKIWGTWAHLWPGRYVRKLQNGSKFKKIVTFPYEGSNKVSHASLGKGI